MSEGTDGKDEGLKSTEPVLEERMKEARVVGNSKLGREGAALEKPAQTGEKELNSKSTIEDSKSSLEELTAAHRWDDAILRSKVEQSVADAASGEKNEARERWKRGALYARMITGPGVKEEPPSDDELPQPASPKGTEMGSKLPRSRTTAFKDMVKDAKSFAYYRDKQTGKRKTLNGQKDGPKAVKVKKELEEQHWLEMIDNKHRYGSNLKYYAEEWQASDARGSFFYWLDAGEGKDLSLPDCPREKLEKQQILYLSVDQRRRYLVEIDRESGKFYWAHPPEEVIQETGEAHPVVDTTGRQWTDLGHGRGIVPVSLLTDSQRQSFDEASLADTHHSDTYESDSSSGSSSDASSVGGSDSSASSVVIPAGPKLLRRSSSMSITTGAQGKGKGKQKGDVWIYVTDPQYRLYCGIKQKGTFQHSSFVAGGPITSAGTLIIKDGILIKCNPMSGHYRTKAIYFKRFIEELEKKGADLSQVKVGATELKLWFIERANTLHALKGKTRRLKKNLSKKLQIA